LQNFSAKIFKNIGPGHPVYQKAFDGSAVGDKVEEHLKMIKRLIDIKCLNELNTYVTWHF
jgi:hypothetical protein